MDRVVVLARGLGTRMRRDEPGVRLSAAQRRVADTGLKAMVPIDRPFLDYVLTTVADAGYRHICLVIGPEHDELRRYYGQVAAERILRFAVVEADERGCLRRVLEKPHPDVVARLPEPIGVSMNCWRFDERIFAACAAIEPSERGELEITAAVQHAIDHLGARFAAVPVRAPVFDLTTRADIAAIAEHLQHTAVRL